MLIACKHQKPDTSSQIFDTISIQESSCKGNCPVYSMIFSSEGKAFYKGKLNVVKEGELTYHFSKDEVSELFKMISIIEFDELNDKYDSGIADLPEIVITYKEKQIVIKDLRTVPKILKNLVNNLQELARTTGYVN